jgi:hypothetical protein
MSLAQIKRLGAPRSSFANQVLDKRVMLFDSETGLPYFGDDFTPGGITPFFPTTAPNLAQIATGKQAVPITAFITDPASTDIADAFDAAKAYCAANGRGLIEFPRDDGYTTSRTLKNDLAGLGIEMRGSKLTTQSQAISAFWALSQGGFIRNGRIVGNGGAARINTVPYFTVPGNRDQNGIWIGFGDRFLVEKMDIANFQAAVAPRNNGITADGTGIIAPTVRQNGVRIVDLISRGCDQGVLASSQNDFEVRNLANYGTTFVYSSEPHMLYMADHTGADNVRLGNGVVRLINLASDSNPYDSAAKIRVCANLYVDSLRIEGSQILVQFESCTALEARGLSIRDQLATVAASDHAIFFNSCPDAKVYSPFVSQRTLYGGRAMRFIGSPRAKVYQAVVETGRADSSGYSPFSIETSSAGATSEDCTFFNPAWRNTPPTPGMIISEPMFSSSSDRLRVYQPETSGVNRLGIFTNANDNVAIIDPALMRDGAAGLGLCWRTTGTGLRNTINLSSTKTATSGSTASLASEETTLLVNRTGSTALAVTLPAAARLGVRYIIKDARGDAVTRIITILPTSGTIDGAASVIINTAYGSKSLMTFDGAAWFTI